MSSSGGQSKSINAIRTALAKIISLNNDFSAVLREHEDVYHQNSESSDGDTRNGISLKRKVKEMGNLNEREKLKKNCTLQQSVIYASKGGNIVDCNKTILDGSIITGKVILEQLENEAASLNVDLSVAAKSLVIAQVKLLAGLAKDGENFDRDLEGIVSTTRLLVSKKILNTTNIGEHLLKESSFLSLPLRALWRFSSTGVVSLEQIIKSIHDENSIESSLYEDLSQLILEGNCNNTYVSIVNETLSVLISIAYDLNITECDSLCKYASGILYSLTERMLDHILEGKAEDTAVKKLCNKSLDSNKDIKISDSESSAGHDVINIYYLIYKNIKISPEAVESYSSAQLLQVLTHRPNLQLGRVLREQELWRSSQANAVLSSLLRSLLVVLGYKAALDTLDLVVTNEEVNWGCVLTLVATALNCHRDSVSILKGMIEQKIRRGCEDQEMESLVVGLLFARHASQEGRHIFPSYSQWFSTLFATESSSPVTDKQSFVFFMRFLTELVPHEPAYCLRAHLTNHMYTPRGCQEILRDYCHLARARLKDLKDTFEPESAIQSVKDKSKVADEVEAAISHYTQTSKVPNFVLEASIFRKPYFRSSFLPLLLAPRPLPDVPDARAKLIETLHATGKIPSNMYNSYIELCQKECAELLTGVFIDVEEDIIIEEPITELSNMLEELVSVSGDLNSETSAVLPVLSRIAQKLEDMMKIYDTKLKDAQHLIIDAKAYNSKLIVFQIIDKFINAVDKVCLTWREEKVVEKNRPVWLSQFLSLLSASGTLQSALYTYLLHFISASQEEESVLSKVFIVGIILSELFSIEGLFLPVVGTSFPEQKPQNFISFLLICLSFATYQSCYLACSTLSCCLDWSLSTSEETSMASFPLPMVHLYDCLAPRIALMKAANEGKDVTMAHVYSYLEGNEVPDCSAIYYGRSGRNPPEKKVHLDEWVAFELKATWENVPLDVRLTYLQQRVLRDFVDPKSGGIQMTIDASDLQERDGLLSLGDVIVKIVFVLLKIGLKEKNAPDMLLVLQYLGQHSQATNICLLKEWYSHYPDSSGNDNQILSFMSICRSLPPQLFMRSDQLLQHSGQLKNMVKQLKVAGGGLELNLCDTSFLLTVLLNAAADPSVKNIQLQQCLAPLRMAIMFHFESLSSIFSCHNNVIGKYNCLEELWTFLKCREVTDVSNVTPQEAGIRCLALCLKTAGSNHELLNSKLSTSHRICCLGWLLAYIGQQQVNGNLPFFPKANNVFSKISEKDKSIILTCKVELEKLLKSQSISKLITKLFTDTEERLLYLSAIPTACIFLAFFIFEVSKQKQIDYDPKKGMELELLDLLIHCHQVLCKAFESKDEVNSEEISSRSRYLNRKSLSTRKDDDIEELEYLSELNKKIFSFTSSLSNETLSRLPKETFLKCEPDLKAAISYKLKSK